MPAIPSMALNEMHTAEKRYEVGREFGKQEAKQRQLRSILNKLTPANFEVLFEQVLDVTLVDPSVVPDFVLQIVGRAIGEPIYCEMYAELCYLIDGKLSVCYSSDNNIFTVKRLVLNECQKIFERGFGVVDEETIKLSEDERTYDKIKSHIRMLGGIQFIGELFKMTMMPSKLMHHIIQKLLEGYQNPDEKNIEALCLLMTTAGEMLDGKSEGLMDTYFCRMLKLSANQKLSSRVRFKVMNAIDLRNNDWRERRKIERPTKIWEMHSACKQHTQYRPYGFNVISQTQLDYDFPVPCVQDAFEEGVLIRRYEHIGRTLFRSIPNNLIRSSHAKILDPDNPDRPPFGYGSGEHQLSPSDVVETQSNLVPSSQTPLVVVHKAERRYEVGKVFGREDAKQRKLRAILNKLTFQNLDKLLLEVREVNIKHVITLAGFVSQIFDKALLEPTYSVVYANFCSYLVNELPGFRRNDETVTFRRLLLTKCQEKFERRDRDQPPVKEGEGEGIDSTSYEVDSKVSEFQGCHQRLGNIQFIGELYRVRMLTEGIMLCCIQTLLNGHQSPNGEDIEALCKLMSIIGDKIDHPRTKKRLDAYFAIMEQLSTSQKLSHQIRFMLMDVIDLRRNEWQRIRKTEKLKKTEDVHTIYRNGLNVIDLCSSDENDVNLNDHFGSSACLDAKIQRKERMVEEDCYILEPDACQSLTTDLERKVALTDDSEEDVCIISEKGQVACRDYPHPRHLCAQYPFNLTNHENSCPQCYCYVCDERAPCEQWEGQLGHCHASDKEHKWIDLRAIFRINKKI
ncbi:MIF4G-like type 3 domain-containing protein [Dioscorea alata]|uniref:MIF4G-like type 3 domain-containing protein n=1 Tax=Dioscorea alata TaxID=55571 RepID=A0ACB7WHB2_DIOAL|nr:MIF4G-like type 3 domain-containing protein [Dioscorea alata]